MFDFAQVKEYAVNVVSDIAMGSLITFSWAKHPAVGAIMTVLGIIYACYRILILHRSAQKIRKQVEAYDALIVSFKGKNPSNATVAKMGEIFDKETKL